MIHHSFFVEVIEILDKDFDIFLCLFLRALFDYFKWDFLSASRASIRLQLSERCLREKYCTVDRNVHAVLCS